MMEIDVRRLKSSLKEMEYRMEYAADCIGSGDLENAAGHLRDVSVELSIINEELES